VYFSDVYWLISKIMVKNFEYIKGSCIDFIVKF